MFLRARREAFFCQTPRSEWREVKKWRQMCQRVRNVTADVRALTENIMLYYYILACAATPHLSLAIHAPFKTHKVDLCASNEF